jgi:hypothetical protein
MEAVEALFDGTVETKFLAYSNAPFAILDVGAPHRLERYAVTSANDAPERDPARWSLEGSADAVTWRMLDVQVGRRFDGRRARVVTSVAPEGAYRWYRFRAENAGGDMTQLAEVELFGTSALSAPAAAAPAPPQDLRAEVRGRTSLELTWTDTSDTEAYFRVERADDGRRFLVDGYADANEPRFTVVGLEPGGRAAYRVLAVNSAGESAPSEVLEAAPASAIAGSPDGASRRYDQAGFTLNLLDGAPGRTPHLTVERVVEEFFATYPRLVADFNPAAPRAVTIEFDPDFPGVAEAHGDRIRISVSHAVAHPEDIDVVVHEAFHLVQAYTTGNVPGWATEGLADYARWAYGRWNNLACWTMQRFAEGQHYTDAYGVTARFFLWVEDAFGPAVLRELDATLRRGAYDDGFWTSRTGRDVDGLWAAYASDPDQPPVRYE